MNVPTKIAAAIGRFTPNQIALIKRNICKGATDDELQLFLGQCERTGLDPFARQIYSIERREKRGDQWVTTRSTQISIDGFRLIAERSGKYAGQLGPYWANTEGEWTDVWLDPDLQPAAAKVGVLRTDFKEPCWGVARFDAYAQKMRDGHLTRMWQVMGDTMLSKCAESLALRKAFPQELSGLYTRDEMEQAEEEIEMPRAAPLFKPDVMVEPPPKPPLPAPPPKRGPGRPPTKHLSAAPHDEETGEIMSPRSDGEADTPDQSPKESEVVSAELLKTARYAATQGNASMKEFLSFRTDKEKEEIFKIGPELRKLINEYETAQLVEPPPVNEYGT